MCSRAHRRHERRSWFALRLPKTFSSVRQQRALVAPRRAFTGPRAQPLRRARGRSLEADPVHHRCGIFVRELPRKCEYRRGLVAQATIQTIAKPLAQRRGCVCGRVRGRQHDRRLGRPQHQRSDAAAMQAQQRGARLRAVHAVETGRVGVARASASRLGCAASGGRSRRRARARRRRAGAAASRARRRRAVHRASRSARSVRSARCAVRTRDVTGHGVTRTA